MLILQEFAICAHVDKLHFRKKARSSKFTNDCISTTCQISTLRKTVDIKSEKKY